MRNPNQITFQTRMTSTRFVTEYGYTSASVMFDQDVTDMQRVYGSMNVHVEKHDGRKWIVISQPTIKEI